MTIRKSLAVARLILAPAVVPTLGTGKKRMTVDPPVFSEAIRAADGRRRKRRTTSRR